MADLSTLQIQISASTTQADKAIANLQKSLSGLNDALNKYSEGSEYAKGLEILTNGLNGVGDAVSGIDVDKIKAVSSAIGSLSTASGKLSGLSKAFNEIGNASVQNPFNGIISGLESLQSISIDQAQFMGVKTLTESFGKLAGVNAPVVAQNLPAIAQGLQSVANITIPSGLGEQLISLGAAVSKLGGKYATNAQGLMWVAEGINGLSSATQNMPDVVALKELASAVSVFGRQSAGNAIANLPALASGFRNLINTLATAPTVSQNVIDLANSLARLAAAGGRVGSSASSGANGLNLFSRSAKNAKRHFTSLAATFGRLYANFFLVIRAARLFKKSIDISSDLREVQNVVATTFGNATGKVQDFADTAILSFGMSELSAKQFASRFQAMGVAMGVTSEQVSKASDFIANAVSRNQRAYTDLGNSMADVSINLTKLAADMGSFYNADYADVAEDLASVMTGMTRPLRKYGLDLTEATLKEWALSHGLDGNIKQMTQAQKTMLRYQYVMANMGHVMGDFQKTANTWANVTRTIGQQFEALGKLIGNALVSQFKPVLIAFREFMNTLLGLTEKAINAIGKLMGWQIEIEGVGVTMEDGMEDYADSIDDATGSAKKLLKTLLPIDELNVLSDPKSGGGADNSGGAGGGSELTTGGGLSIKPYESDVENWFDFGRRIRDALVDGLTIDWDEIEGKVNAKAARLAFILNGLLSPDENGDYVLGKKIGEFLANTLNMGFRWMYMFATTFEWKDLGNTISTGINSFFETWKPELTADAISNMAGGVLEATVTAIEGVNWETAGAKLMELFMGIDWARIWTDVSDLIVAIFNAIVSAAKGAIQKAKDDPEAFGEAVINFAGLSLLFGGAKLSSALIKYEFMKVFSNANIGKVLGTQLFTGFGATWKSLGGLKGIFLTDFATIAGAGTAAEIGMAIGSAVMGGIVAAIAGFWAGKKMGSVIFPEDKQYYDDFKWLGEGGFFDTLKSSIEDGTIKGAFHEFTEDVKADFSGLGEKLSEIGTRLKDGFKEKIDFAEATFIAVGVAFGTVVNNIRDSITTAITNVANLVRMNFTAFKMLIANIIGSVTEAFSKIGVIIADMHVKLTTFFTNLGTGVIEIGTRIKDTFANIWQAIQDIFSKGWDIKTPHISWEDSGSQASGWLKDTLEKLNLPTSLPRLKVEWYASGGYPQVGSLFVAGEAGAEMVGSIGGRTGVASNGEITGIASAIYETASQTNALLRGVISTIEQKETGISQETLFASVRSSAKSYRMRTGADAFV